MTFKSQKQMWKLILRNAAILGGISGASQMLVTQDFSYTSIMTGLFTGILVGLLEIKHAFKITPSPKFKKGIQSTFFLV